MRPYFETALGKLYHGDCLEIMPELEPVDLIIIDPPYLTTKEVWDKQEEVAEGLSKELLRIAKESCSLYVWCGIGEKSQSLIRWFPIFSEHWYFKDLITWKKQRGMGNRRGWLYVREEILWFVKNNNNFIWNKDEQYSNIKRISGNNFGFKAHKEGYKILNDNYRIKNIWDDIPETTWDWKNKTKHYTPKPLQAIERIIELHTKENNIVLDTYLGSGTTAIACERLNRKWIGIEISEEYCEIAAKRIERETQQLKMFA